MGIFSDYLKVLRSLNPSYLNLTLFEVLSPDRMKRPFDAQNLNKVLIDQNFDADTFTKIGKHNLDILSRLQKVAEVREENGKRYPQYTLPLTPEKMEQIVDVFREISIPIVKDLILTMKEELVDYPELVNTETDDEIEKRAIEFSRSYLFNLLPRSNLFTMTEANQPTVIALNDLAVVCNAHDPIVAFYKLYEEKLVAAFGFEPNKPLMTAPTDVKLGKLLSVMGTDRFNEAAIELFPALAREANVKPEELRLTEISVTSNKDKQAMMAVKMIEKTYDKYHSSAKRTAKEIQSRMSVAKSPLEKSAPSKSKPGFFARLFEKKSDDTKPKMESQPIESKEPKTDVERRSAQWISAKPKQKDASVKTEKEEKEEKYTYKP